MIQFDLTNFQCPQLFVQFKYQLKKALEGNYQVTFKLSPDADAADIESYLDIKQIRYQIQNSQYQSNLVIFAEQSHSV